MRLNRILIVIFISCFTINVQAQIPKNYYAPVLGLNGDALRQGLHDIIDGHNVLSYSALWSHFEQCDQNDSGKVWDIYTDVPSGNPTYTFDFGTDQCGNYSGEGDCFNREHAVPSSWFNDASPMRTDLHHIFPTDGWVNGQRANHDYGEVSSPSYTSSNGSKVGPNTFSGSSGTAFEPIDEYKGDIARVYFYMATRYADVMSSWTGDMFSGSNLSNWAEDMLLIWHGSDPVSSKEMQRNDSIYLVQDNRNPFVDHPEYVSMIWGPVAGVEHYKPAEVKFRTTAQSIVVELSSHEYAELMIADLTGRVVLNQELSQGLNNLHLGNTEGMLVAIARTEKSIYTFKFLNQ